MANRVNAAGCGQHTNPASRHSLSSRSILESGDVFVFGGPARLRYHGVSRIEPGTAPAGLPFEGRLNLTFRQF